MTTIEPMYLGELLEGEYWTAWTKPSQAKADIEILSMGLEIPNDAVLWPSKTGTITVWGAEKFKTSNQRGEEFFLIPAGTRVQFCLHDFDWEDQGPFFWYSPDGENSYNYSCKGVLTIS